MNVLISSTIDKDIKKSVELAKELGLGLELSRIPNIINNKKPFNDVLKEMENIFKDFSKTKSVHGLFFNLAVASPDDDIREISIKRYMQSLDIAKIIGAETIVFHTGNEATIKHKGFQENFIQNSISFWEKYVKHFEDATITAVIENVSENTYEPILRVIKAINSDYLKASLDVGHVNIHSNHNVLEWIDGYGQNLKHMHLHNNHTDDDSHASLLDGTLNFGKIFDEIRKQNINPVLVLEIFNKNALFESINYLKEIGVIK